MWLRNHRLFECRRSFLWSRFYSLQLLLFVSFVFVFLLSSSWRAIHFISNNECSVCESKLTAETEDLQFRPREIQGESSNMKIQLLQISRSLNELKTLLVEQKKEHLVAIGSVFIWNVITFIISRCLLDHSLSSWRRKMKRSSSCRRKFTK